MYVRDLSAYIEWHESIGVYKVTLGEFLVLDDEGNKNPHVFYLTPEEIPTKWADQTPVFKVGDLIDQVWHPDDGNYFGGEDGDYREYMGRITEIEIKQRNDKSPKRVFYYTDIWTRSKSNGIRQDGLEISLNPTID